MGVLKRLRAFFFGSYAVFCSEASVCLRYSAVLKGQQERASHPVNGSFADMRDGCCAENCGKRPQTGGEREIAGSTVQADLGFLTAGIAAQSVLHAMPWFRGKCLRKRKDLAGKFRKQCSRNCWKDQFFSVFT